ncbi:Alpha-tubulin suppressor [Duganella sacchari]|uniref:Alpha-tubulin suppressor n=1 Tax=Duganella sacchari TaxID=551987 RepID=A0A1M7J9G2_9BURK|nr:hypothetical protein [Duganella sacchari]SHM49649.1 Alpha-tubulin suppressor [Duganella sacchari]
MTISNNIIDFVSKILSRISIIFFFIFASSNSNAAVAVAVGAGAIHSCAALAEGGVKCWGSNGFGQLGNGTTVASLVPVTVQGLSNEKIVAIGGGQTFTCALTSTGTVYCWGQNNYLQLGNNKIALSTTPIPVQIPTGAAKSLTVGMYHACVLDVYGNIYCWGLNTSAQLNRNTLTTKSSVLLYSAGMNDVVALRGDGYSTCYRDTNGGAKCFGYNKNGQLGLGFKDATDGATYGAPNYVLGLSNNVLSTSASMYHSCAVKTDHTTLCWGSNLFGSLGFSPTGSDAGIFLTPTVVPGLRGDAVSVVTGYMHSCVITAVGGAQCWGKNGVGQLGNGRALPYESASDVIGLNEKITSLAMGSSHSCALLESGTVKCFGQATSGQLGTGTTTYSPVPVTVNL